MKSIAIYGIVIAAASQAMAGRVLGSGPYVGRGPVVRTTNEPEDDPVWNSAGIDESAKIKLKVTDHVAETSKPSWSEMGQMGERSYQCGMCKNFRGSSLTSGY